MDKKDIKNILMSLRTVNNEYVVNFLLGKLDMMDEQTVLEEVNKIGNDEFSVRKFLEDKIETQLRDDADKGKHHYYPDAIKNNRESKSFSQIRTAYKKISEILERAGINIYIAGGSVPYFLLNEDSNRLHDDIDSICKIEDIDKIREAVKAAGLYKAEWDSKSLLDNGQDYGLEIEVEGVPVGIYPFEYKNGEITQFTYDPYEHYCKTQKMKVETITDYIGSYKSVDGRQYDTMSLEYIKKSKDKTIGRPKDAADAKKIAEFGFRQDVYDRIQLPKLIRSCRAEDLNLGIEP